MYMCTCIMCMSCLVFTYICTYMNIVHHRTTDVRYIRTCTCMEAYLQRTQYVIIIVSFIDVDVEYLVPTYIYIHMYIHMYICTENTVTDGPKFLCFLYNYVLVLV